jgi:hypothetical protein
MTQRFALVSALALCLAGAAAGSAHADSLSFTSNMTGDKDLITCSDVDISFWENSKGHDGIVTVRRDQTIAIRAPGAGPLRVTAPSNGGVWVQTSSNGTMTAVVCEAAGARSESAANALLDQVRIVNEGGELRVKGPDHDWGGYIILSVPNGVSLDASAENGAIDVRGVQGTFTLETMNGPIEIAHVRGKVDARASNGPIGFIGHEGDMDLRASNGPVSVKLDSPSWSGKGLYGASENGPIKVVVPDNLQTGVRVQSSSHSSWNWKGRSVMSNDDSYGDDSRTVQLGKGPVLIRVSTVNGPVEIKAPGAEKISSKSHI